MKPIRVIGIGSSHGDDAIGLEAIRMLQCHIGDMSGVELHAVDSGQRLLDFLDGSGGLIVIDAMKDAGTAPGTIERLTWPDPRIEALQPGSTHAFGPADALRLAEALDQLPGHVVIYAVQAENTRPQTAMCRRVAATLVELVRLLREETEALWAQSS